MNRTELLEIVGKAEMAPLIDQEETPGVQVGWYKMCHEPIPELDELRKNADAFGHGGAPSGCQYLPVYCALSAELALIGE